MSEDEKTAKEIAAAEQAARLATEFAAAEEAAEEVNKLREGKGTRIRVSQTKGKGTRVISFESFDMALPATLPTTMSEFMELTKVSDEPVIVSYLLDGYNDAAYSIASDPTAEYVDTSWTPEVQKQFRLVVRNYAQATSVSIEDAVALIKPGIVASQGKK